MNGWNNVRENNGAKTVGGSVAIKPNDQLSIIQNYMVGRRAAGQRRRPAAPVRHGVSLTLTDKVTLMGNYDYGRDKIVGESVDWSGVAGYLKYQAHRQPRVHPAVRGAVGLEGVHHREHCRT